MVLMGGSHWLARFSKLIVKTAFFLWQCMFYWNIWWFYLYKILQARKLKYHFCSKIVFEFINQNLKRLICFVTIVLFKLALVKLKIMINSITDRILDLWINYCSEFRFQNKRLIVEWCQSGTRSQAPWELELEIFSNNLKVKISLCKNTCSCQIIHFINLICLPLFTL